MADPTAIQETFANAGSALAIVPALEWAKRHSGPWLAWVNHQTAPVISMVVAAGVAAGIHFTFDPVTGAGTITFTAAGIAWAIFESVKQWLGQHWVHKAYQGLDTAKTIAKAIEQWTAIQTPSVTGTKGTGNGAKIIE